MVKQEGSSGDGDMAEEDVEQGAVDEEDVEGDDEGVTEDQRFSTGGVSGQYDAGAVALNSE